MQHADRRRFDRRSSALVDRAVLACLEYYGSTSRGPRKLEDVASYAKEWLLHDESARIGRGETGVPAIAGRVDGAVIGDALQRLKRAGRVELVRGVRGWRLR